MQFSKVSKAVAGAITGGGATAVTAAVVDAATSSAGFGAVPGMPWQAWVAITIFNGLLGFATVYFAPRNRAI